MMPPWAFWLWGAILLLAVLCFGCVDYAALSRGTSLEVDGAAVDLLSAEDGGNITSDGGTPDGDTSDLAKPAPGSACTLLDDGGAGVVSTAGTCVSSACSTGTVMVGTSPPAGTVATPTPAFGDPSNLFDGSLCTGWNMGAQSATITLTFPSPITFSQVQVANAATPTTNETYTYYGLIGSTWTQIGSHTYAVGPSAVQSPVSVTAGTYDGLRMVVTGSSSNVLVYEVTLGG